VTKDRLYLESIRDYLERIAEYTEPGEGTFHASRLIQDGVIRNLGMPILPSPGGRSHECEMC
jgi:uncharacterized protein with HEPN domain